MVLCMNNEINPAIEKDIRPLQSKNFQKNFDVSDRKGLISICAICGKGMKHEDVEVGVIFHTGGFDYISGLPTQEASNAALDAAGMGFYPIGPDCLRKTKTALAGFLHTADRWGK